MTDLANVKACAELMAPGDGHTVARDQVFLWTEHSGYSVHYDPRANDAQAMALLKKFPQECAQAIIEHLADHVTDHAIGARMHVIDVNAAIVECAAKLHAQLQVAEHAGGQS